MNSILSQYISVPLCQNAHRWAEEFAAQQDSLEKGKQVYLNTLAVYAVHSYLKWLKIDTALNQGDSWHRGVRAIFDVADLVVTGIGQLECRPVLPGESSIILPAEVTTNRIGYIAVKFSHQLDFVELLGFVPATAISDTTQTLEIRQLQSLDALIDTINRLSLLVNLRQWFKGIFNSDWQSPELLLAGNFRRINTITRQDINPQSSSVSRAKVIHVVNPVVILLQLTPTATEFFDIRLRVYPGDDTIYLPEKLQLIVLDEAENICMSAQARSTDNWMQLEFSCQHEEKFRVRLVLDETSITEDFVV